MISDINPIFLAGGDNLRTQVIRNGVVIDDDAPDYAKVQGIFIGVVAAFVIVVTILGPEHHGAHFERAKAAFEEGAGDDQLAEGDEDAGPSSSGSHGVMKEKHIDSPRHSVRSEPEKDSQV